MKETFYVTTPIYYVNDEPHLGHAYTTVLADVLARYARLNNRPTFFLTGVDEHGQKVQQAAERQNTPPKAYVDQMVVRFQSAWEQLKISYDDFIRTTESRHVRVVQHVLQTLWDQGEIYRGEYQGWYCVPDERFWTEKDLVDNNCPDCGRPVEQISEGNYFFRMSKYQDWLVGYIEEHPDFIRPAYRRNEVLGFLRKPLADLCISRPVSRLSWGIPLPFAPEYVTYVWFDALLNYVTAAGYLVDDQRFTNLWPQALHLIGKDILTTHSVYWPTMLKGAGLPMPRGIFAHGWWIIGGMKMSKSRGNVIKPLDLATIYGVDAFRYFLMRDMVLGQDADFSEERFVTRYQVELANNLGNLLHRITNMIVRYFDGVVPASGEEGEAERSLREQCSRLAGSFFPLVEDFALHQALGLVVDVLVTVNQYLEQSAPWKEAKAGRTERVATTLYTSAEALRFVSVLFAPVMPEKMAELWKRLGWEQKGSLSEALDWGSLRPGAKVHQAEPLFPRLDVEEARTGQP